MSFSTDIKKELTTISNDRKCCALAEISGILRFAGSIKFSAGRLGIKVSTGNPALARYYLRLIKDYFGAKSELSFSESESPSGGTVYELTITPEMNADAILRETGILSVKEGSNYVTDGLDPQIIKKRCCKRAMLRGIFMAAGSVSNPRSKGYHFEISCSSEYMASDVKKLLAALGIKAKEAKRREKYIVYLKDSEQISDILGIMGSNSQLFKLQDAIIKKQIVNEANRIFNCENANLNKSVDAAQKQLRDIELIEETSGLGILSPKLLEAASFRKLFPELCLSELAEKFDPPLKKSGLVHRLSKISAIADRIRMGENL